MTDIPELTEEQLEKAIPARLRKRLMQGRFESGEDIAALRRFVGLTQADFARAIEITAGRTRDCVASNRCATPADHSGEPQIRGLSRAESSRRDLVWRGPEVRSGV
jgi:hypothetical protein